MPHLPLRLLAAVAVLAALVAPGFARAAEKPALDPFAVNKRLGRGVNVLGYDAFWKTQEKSKFKAEYFRMLRDAGFQHVRIVMHPFRDGKQGPDHKIAPEWFAAADWAVREARATGLMVILDLHEYLDMGKTPEALKDRYLASWRQIAEHFKQADDDVLFELLNEPNNKLTPELWNEYLKEALAIVRQSNPGRTVIIGPGNYNSTGALPKLIVPDADRNLIITVHYYSPMAFTHQGASWTNQQDKVGIAWQGTPAEREAIARDFEKVQKWAEEHKRPIYLGEFGAYDKGAMADRARWTAAVAREAEKHGWSWGYWYFEGGFSLYDSKAGAFVEPIYRALVPK